MGDISAHFSSHEFACQGENCCSHTSIVLKELIYALERLRTRIRQPLIINSGFRCLTYNREVDSKDSSQHVKGSAADIALVEGMTPNEMGTVAWRVLGFEYGGVGIYDWGIHVDVRLNGAARWDRQT